ncbi:hypothetical protein CSHISOI_09670 [Colletotrichum shisoi]|uniref:Uncharacterized protein n=1 Tax=Colletotrichum shisoi TaxID=2078593 RepID=A0A5Q4BG45_9PEZI|nr:hypothetical protein CSHISOI_09670 [Colletotrichum shisoi]
MARIRNWQEGVEDGSFPNKLVWLEGGKKSRRKVAGRQHSFGQNCLTEVGTHLPTYLPTLGIFLPGRYSTSPTEQNQHNSGLVCCHHDLRPVPNLKVEFVLLVGSWLSGPQEIKLFPRRKSIRPNGLIGLRSWAAKYQVFIV